MPAPFRIIFVCLGNICRSPAAEGVMQRLVDEAGLSGAIALDSASTAGWHAGKPADARMRSAASHRGFSLTSLARQVTAADLHDFDLILAMDQANLRDLQSMLKPGKAPSASVHQRENIRLFCDFCTTHSVTEVPDPYYDDASGFEKVLDILEDGCAGLLEHVRARLPH